MRGRGEEKDIQTGDSIFAVWGNRGAYTGTAPAWRERLRVTHEISARHDSSPDGEIIKYVSNLPGLDGPEKDFV